jgi:uncharacterized protein
MGDLDREGRTALHYASLEGDVARVRALIDEGEDVSLADRGGMTPLHFAAQERQPEVAEALLAAGASVDAQDEHGNSPLFTAVFNARGDGAVINLLRAAAPTRGASTRMARARSASRASSPTTTIGASSTTYPRRPESTAGNPGRRRAAGSRARARTRRA